MTISWVAEEKPSSTAARAMEVRLAGEARGSVNPIQQMAMMIMSWETSSHPLRLPSTRVNNGSGRRSTSGAQMNLNE